MAGVGSGATCGDGCHHVPVGFPRAAARRHAAGPGRTRRRGGRGFGAGTLLATGGLAMVAGLASGAAVSGLPLPWASAPPAAPVVAGPMSAAEEEPEEEVELPFVPVVDDVAGPAQPVLFDMDVVGPDGLSLADRSVGLLSREVPSFATGELVVVPGSSPAPHPDRKVRTIRVEVEKGLAVDGELFAATVMATLNDPRSWGGDGSMSFARTDGSADIRVVLATPDKVDAMCAPLNTHGDYSCGRYGHAAINYARWVTGTEEYLQISDITTYRQYVVNHEVGHLLGRQHTRCPGAGERAPVMQQQSVRVAPCVANPWPFPDNAVG